MEEAHNASSSKNEARGIDFHLGVEGSNSNGDGEEIDKEGNMMKIIEILQKDHESQGSTGRIQHKVDTEPGKDRK